MCNPNSLFLFQNEVEADVVAQAGEALQEVVDVVRPAGGVDFREVDFHEVDSEEEEGGVVGVVGSEAAVEEALGRGSFGGRGRGGGRGF